LGINPPLAVGDKVVFTLTGGATFADTVYLLEEWDGGAGTDTLDYASLLLQLRMAQRVSNFKCRKPQRCMVGLYQALKYLFCQAAQ